MMLIDTNSLTLTQLTERIAKVTGCEAKLVRNRVRHWARQDFLWISDRVGAGTGVRRLYDPWAIVQGAILIELSFYLEGEHLGWAVTYVNKCRQKILDLANGKVEMWLIMEPTEKGWEFWGPRIFMAKTQNDMRALFEGLKESDRFFGVNLSRILRRI
jgi:hypothetical protein